MTKNTSFWEQPIHLYGCYGAITVCLLVLLGFFSLSWWAASILGYGVGWFGYAIRELLHSDTTATEHVAAAPEVTQPKERPQPQLRTKPSLLQDFLTIKQKVEHLLPKSSLALMDDIQAVLVILNQKIRHSSNPSTKQELIKIQKIINEYLTPTLQRYHDLPVMFHDRHVQGQPTPNQLISTQLQLIYDELLQVTESVFSDDLNALMNHGEFLQQKLQPPVFFKVGRSLHEEQDG